MSGAWVFIPILTFAIGVYGQSRNYRPVIDRLRLDADIARNKAKMIEEQLAIYHKHQPRTLGEALCEVLGVPPQEVEAITVICRAGKPDLATVECAVWRPDTRSLDRFTQTWTQTP